LAPQRIRFLYRFLASTLCFFLRLQSPYSFLFVLSLGLPTPSFSVITVPSFFRFSPLLPSVVSGFKSFPSGYSHMDFSLWSRFVIYFPPPASPSQPCLRNTAGPHPGVPFSHLLPSFSASGLLGPFPLLSPFFVPPLLRTGLKCLFCSVSSTGAHKVELHFFQPTFFPRPVPFPSVAHIHFDGLLRWISTSSRS